ncbi:MAG: gliding motility protein GldM [Bacteroidales bacterium]|nr:gliding motility protein GldM [Bacteroidales bacterium]
MATGNKISPRQKMINLMYLVFLAMLAMNVSSDVLNGFRQVDDSLNKSNAGASWRNDIVFEELKALKESNPEKAEYWYNKAFDVRANADSIFNYIQSLKCEIVAFADGDDYDINNINHRESLEATNVVMLSPTSGKGKLLKGKLDSYREILLKDVVSPTDKKVISEYLSTAVPENAANDSKNWQTAIFENVPVAASVTLLTKMQGDVRNAEGIALNALKSGIDEGDLRVNRINAFVIPSSNNVMRGSKYSARIVLAAIDSTKEPEIFINDKLLEGSENGYFETYASSIGSQTLEGYIKVSLPDGSMEKYPFKSYYVVSEPTATVSNTMMNVMYAGIENPISISVPGIPNSQMNASMSNGVLSRKGNEWTAKPTTVGQEAVITVNAQSEGRSVTVAKTSFRVRQLPDPMPFIEYKDEKGVMKRFKGKTPISKSLLMTAPGIMAAIDDDLLNVDFKVIGFETIFFDSMGNALPEISDGSSFSQRQKDAIRRLSRGKRFFISRVKAVGPDGVERTISPLEVIVN